MDFGTFFAMVFAKGGRTLSWKLPGVQLSISSLCVKDSHRFEEHFVTARLCQGGSSSSRARSVAGDEN